MRPESCAGAGGSGGRSRRTRLVPVLARHTRVARVAGFVAGVLGLEGAVAPFEREEQVALVDELIARVVRHGVHPGVHADGVAGARLDAVPAEDAPELVDDELDREPLVAAA